MDSLYFFDFISGTPQLKINSRNKYHTVFGLILSLTAIICIIASAIYLIFICFSRKNFKIFERTEHNLIPSARLFENKFGFLTTDIYGDEYVDLDRLMYIEAIFWEIKLNKKNIQGTNIYQPQIIPLKNCSIFSDENNNDIKKMGKEYPSSQCLDFTNLNKELYGRVGSFSG